MDDRDGDEAPIPEIILLGNRAGFQYLSKLFAYLADRETPRTLPSGHPDPDDHLHLDADERHSMRIFLIGWNFVWVRLSRDIEMPSFRSTISPPRAAPVAA